MNTIKLIFCTTDGPVSWAIRAETNSQWSHVGFVDGDIVVESISKQGVHEEPLASRQAASSKWQLVELECADPEAVLAAARTQLGKPYDYSAVLDIAIRDRDDWQDERSWFCSELVAWALDKGGSPKFRRSGVGRITPDHVWMLAPASAETGV